MKPQYQTRYELLHESYQKWLTGFTRHAVSWGVCHPNIYYFHNLTPGWVSFNGEKPEIAIVPQSLHRLIYGPDSRTAPRRPSAAVQIHQVTQIIFYIHLCTTNLLRQQTS